MAATFALPSAAFLRFLLPLLALSASLPSASWAAGARWSLLAGKHQQKNVAGPIVGIGNAGEDNNFNDEEQQQRALLARELLQRYAQQQQPQWPLESLQLPSEWPMLMDPQQQPMADGEEEVEENGAEPKAKRAQTFVRFGKRAQTFVRFGKRAQTFVRFGRDVQRAQQQQQQKSN